MKNRKGFTLVELLAVIVILAIIMIIAIPSVLSVMKTSRQKSFVEYVEKIRTLGEQTYLSDELNGVTQDTCTVYDIEKDLGLDNTGNYHGYILVVKNNNDIKYYQTLYDDNYMVYGIEYNDNFTTKSLLDYLDSAKTNQLSAEYLASVGGCSSYTDRSSGGSNAVSITDAISSSTYYKTVEGKNGWTGTYKCENGVGTISSCAYKDGTTCDGGDLGVRLGVNLSNYMCTVTTSSSLHLYDYCNVSFSGATISYGGELSETITC